MELTERNFCAYQQCKHSHTDSKEQTNGNKVGMSDINILSISKLHMLSKNFRYHPMPIYVGVWVKGRVHVSLCAVVCHNDNTVYK